MALRTREERKARINTYVQELEEQTENLEKLQKSFTRMLWRKTIRSTGFRQTELYSWRDGYYAGSDDVFPWPGEQILKGLGKGSSEEKG